MDSTKVSWFRGLIQDTCNENNIISFPTYSLFKLDKPVDIDLQANIRLVEHQINQYKIPEQTPRMMAPMKNINLENKSSTERPKNSTDLPSIFLTEPEGNENVLAQGNITMNQRSASNSKSDFGKIRLVGKEANDQKTLATSRIRAGSDSTARSSPNLENDMHELVFLGMERKIVFKKGNGTHRARDVVTPALAIELQISRSRGSKEMLIHSNQKNCSNFDSEVACFVAERKRSSSTSPPINQLNPYFIQENASTGQINSIDTCAGSKFV